MPRLLRCLAFLSVALATLWPSVSHAQWGEWSQEWPRLEVLDPRQGRWSSQPGTIEAAEVVVRPKGVYAEVELFLTLSARDSYFGQGDTLETALYFELPEDAAFTDSWLWFEGEILRAAILDGWTARETYEDIVRRNRDPSILYKRGGGRYELRVFPMEATESRRLKLTYVVPVDWTAETVSVPLPTSLLKASASPVDVNVVRVGLDSVDEPTWITEAPQLGHAATTSDSLGLYATIAIPANAVPSEPLTLAWDAPETSGGVFYSTVKRGAETWYQVAALPSAVFERPGGQSVAVVVEYEALADGIQDIRPDDVLGRLAARLTGRLTPADSFSVALADSRIAAPEPARWHPAYPDTIAARIEALRPRMDGATSDVQSAVRQGIGALGARSGSVILLSTDRPAAATDAAALVEQLHGEFGDLPPVFSINLDAAQTPAPTGARWTEFYEALAEATGGSAQEATRSSELDAALVAALAGLPFPSGRFDLYTTRDGGICYERRTLRRAGGPQPMERAVLQVGQCFGEGAFVVELGGLAGGAPMGTRIRPEAPTLPADTTLIAMWTATQITELEAGGERADLVEAVLALSLRERVLSKYTAFLALEPGQGGEVCSVCATQLGGGVAIANEESGEDPTTLTLEAYPNPFRDRVTLGITLPEGTAPGDVTVAVYNLLGQRVRELTLPSDAMLSALTLVWNGDDDAGRALASGTYLLVLTTPTARHTASLVLAR